MVSKKHALYSLFCASALHGMIHTLSLFLSPLNLEIAAYFQSSSIGAITTFKTVYLIVYAISNLIFGSLTHRLPVRQTLSIGMLVNALPIITFYFIPTDRISLMYGLWILAALGGGVYHPVANAFITRKFPERKGWALGITGIGSGVGFAFGPLVTGLLSKLGFNWQAISLMFGLAALGLGILAYLVIRDDGKDEAEPSARDVLTAARAPQLGAHPALRMEGRNGNIQSGLTWPLLGFLSWMILFTAGREIAMWSVLDVSAFFLEVTAQEGKLASWYLFIMYLPGIATQPFVGAWSDRWGRRGFALFTFGLFGASLALLPFLPIGWYFLPYFFMGAAQSSTVPLVEAMIADRTTPQNRGMMFGVFITAIMAFGALGPFLSGTLLDSMGMTLQSFRILFGVMGGAVIVSGIGLFLYTGLVRCRQMAENT